MLKLLEIIISWPVAFVVIASLAYKVSQKFIPSKNDKTLQKLNEFEKILTEQQTEISKLNVLMGIGQTQKNRENLVKGLTGLNVGR